MMRGRRNMIDPPLWSGSLCIFVTLVFFSVNLLSSCDAMKTSIPTPDPPNTSLCGATYSLASERGAMFAERKEWKSAEVCFARAQMVATDDLQKCEALANLAACQGAQANYDTSLKTLKEALRQFPSCVRAHHDIGRLLSRSPPHLSTAASHLSKCVEIDPSNMNYYEDLAQILFSMEKIDEAMNVYKDAVTINPKFARGFQQIAVILRERKEFGESEKYYKTAINLEPNNANFRYSHGNMLFDSGFPAKASSEFSKAISLNPQFADAYNNKGNAERSLGKLDKALKTFLQGYRVNPKGAMFLLNAGQVYQDMNKLEECEEMAKKALEIDPKSAEGYLLLGSVRYTRDLLEDAAQMYREAIKLNPTLASAYVSLGNTLGDIYRKGESALLGEPSPSALSSLHLIHRDCISTYSSLLSFSPSHIESFANMMWAKKYVCDWENWDENYEKLMFFLQNQVEGKVLPSLKPFLALPFPISPVLYRQIAALHAAEEGKKAGLVGSSMGVKFPLQWNLELLGGGGEGGRKKMVVGYISSDLQDHPVGHQAWFHLHRSKNVKIILFSTGKDDKSEWRRKIRDRAEKNGGEFVDLNGMTNSVEQALKINSMHVHALITLNGWTSGNQMGCFSLKPAPIQIEYMGSHDTTGADYFDYFFSDKTASPPEFSSFFSEKLSYLPYSFFMNEYRESRAHILHPPKDFIAPTRASVGLPADPFIFCNFNQLFKADPSTFAAWMEILRRVPNSILWLLRLPFGAESFVRKEADKLGISSSRLFFSNRGDWKTHLHIKKLCNLSLDLPYFNSHTSGVDILWGGVPFLSLPSQTMSGRVGASLIRGMRGEEEEEEEKKGGNGDRRMEMLIMRNIQDYVDTAVVLANNKQSQLLSYRRHLQSSRENAVLFHTKLTTFDVERSLQLMWEAKSTTITTTTTIETENTRTTVEVKRKGAAVKVGGGNEGKKWHLVLSPRSLQKQELDAE